MQISIILPVLNEETAVKNILPLLASVKSANCEIILVDGGSCDNTVKFACEFADQVIISEPGRAMQMNTGASQASGDILLFLHIDTVLPDNALQILTEAYHASPQMWGRFNVRLSGQHPFFRVIETLMNWRSCLTGIATGDQGIFISNSLFKDVGGFPQIPLMEDIAISRMLKRIEKPLCIKDRVITSSRRWEANGILSTVLLMWKLRLLYWFGIDPQKIAVQYYR